MINNWWEARSVSDHQILEKSSLMFCGAGEKKKRSIKKGWDINSDQWYWRLVFIRQYPVTRIQHSVNNIDDQYQESLTGPDINIKWQTFVDVFKRISINVVLSRPHLSLKSLLSWNLFGWRGWGWMNADFVDSFLIQSFYIGRCIWHSLWHWWAGHILQRKRNKIFTWPIPLGKAFVIIEGIPKYLFIKMTQAREDLPRYLLFKYRFNTSEELEIKQIKWDIS